jgi:hypothetical protein
MDQFRTFPHCGDTLRGAGAIAEYLFGSRSDRRRVYYFVEKGAIPVFRVGVILCARKSTLQGWVEAQERRSCAEWAQPDSVQNVSEVP